MNITEEKLLRKENGKLSEPLENILVAFIVQFDVEPGESEKQDIWDANFVFAYKD